MSKKVAILTLPLIYNYGAILQAYALQKSVQRLGAECWLIDKELPVYPYYRRPLSVVSRIIGRYLHGEKDIEILPYWMPKSTEQIISMNTRRFVERHIVPKTSSIKRLTNKDDQYDVYLVGSDQVWRKSVTLKMDDYLFGFVSDKKKKCSYAASFGVDYWEFGKSETEKLKPLFQKMNMITVREDSAVGMLKKYIGVNAVHVVDPTLLLSREDYCRIISDMPKRDTDTFVFSYVLDASDTKKRIINHISKIKGKRTYSIMPKSTPGYRVNIEDCVYVGVEEWIRGFRDCECVVTDSFHGTVFSIIFNKPFFVLRNDKRGNTRLESLLRMFGLQNRVVTSYEETGRIIAEEIKWDNVNRILKEKRAFSLGKLAEMIN